MTPVVVLHPEGKIPHQRIPLSDRPTDIFGFIAQGIPKIGSRSEKFPSVGNVSQETNRSTPADPIVLLVGLTGIAFHLSHRIPHLTSKYARFYGPAHAAIQVAIGTELTASLDNRIHAEAKLP